MAKMTNRTILIIDDHHDFREMLRSFIERRFRDVTIKEAGTGEEGVRMAKTEKPALCLIDIRLPGIDGIETAKQIKQMYPDTQIITMSMFTQSYLQDLINQKVIFYLNKAKIDSDLAPLLHKFLNGEKIDIQGGLP